MTRTGLTTSDEYEPDTLALLGWSWISRKLVERDARIVRRLGPPPKSAYEFWSNAIATPSRVKMSWLVGSFVSLTSLVSLTVSVGVESPHTRAWHCPWRHTSSSPHAFSASLAPRLSHVLATSPSQRVAQGVHRVGKQRAVVPDASSIEQTSDAGQVDWVHDPDAHLK